MPHKGLAHRRTCSKGRFFRFPEFSHSGAVDCVQIVACDRSRVQAHNRHSNREIWQRVSPQSGRMPKMGRPGRRAIRGFPSKVAERRGQRFRWSGQTVDVRWSSCGLTILVDFRCVCDLVGESKGRVQEFHHWGGFAQHSIGKWKERGNRNGDHDSMSTEWSDLPTEQCQQIDLMLPPTVALTQIQMMMSPFSHDSSRAPQRKKRICCPGPISRCSRQADSH
jgi:hypothetical protein